MYVCVLTYAHHSDMCNALLLLQEITCEWLKYETHVVAIIRQGTKEDFTGVWSNCLLYVDVLVQGHEHWWMDLTWMFNTLVMVQEQVTNLLQIEDGITITQGILDSFYKNPVTGKCQAFTPILMTHF